MGALDSGNLLRAAAAALLMIAGAAACGQDSRGAPDSREVAAIAGRRFVGLYSSDIKLGCGAIERTVADDGIVVAINAATDLKVAPGRLVAAYSRVLEFDPRPPRQLRKAVETIENPRQVSQATRVESRTVAIDAGKATWTRTLSRRGPDGAMTKLEDDTKTTAAPKYTLDDELRGQLWIKGGPSAGASITLPRLDLLARKMTFVRLQVLRRATSRAPGLAESRIVVCLERDDAAGRESFVAFRPDGWPCFLELERDLTIRGEADGFAQSPIGWDGYVAGPVLVTTPLMVSGEVHRLDLRLGGPLAAIFETAPGQVAEKDGDGIVLRLDLKARGEGLTAADRRKWTESTTEFPALDREIVGFAKDAVQGAPATSRDRVVALMGAVRETVADHPIPDGVTATQVLAYRRGGARGKVMLLVAAARALKIPAREVRGFTYEGGGELRSYLPHWWAEVDLDGAWLALDPAAGQLPADVRHIRCRALTDAELALGPGAVLTIAAKE